MIGFIAGTMFGACLGVLLAGLLRMASDDGDGQASPQVDAETANDNARCDAGRGVA